MEPAHSLPAAREHVAPPRDAPGLDSLLNELAAHYARVNREKFRSVLPDVTITVNRRLRALTGRVLYDLRLIELSLYHLTQPYGRAQAFSTLEHEMLHLYLDTLGQPPGHTPTFKHLAKQLSIPLWHCFSYPRNRPSTTTYVYRCPCCGWTVRRSRRLSEIQRSACGPCCRAHNHGRFDPRFVVELIETIEEKAAHRPGAQQRPRGPMPGLPHPHRTPCRCAS